MRQLRRTVKKSITKFHALRAYARYIVSFKYRFLAVVACFAVANILLAVVPVFVGQLVEQLTAQPIQHTGVYWVVGILIFLSVGHDTIWHLGDWLYRGLLNAKQYEFENILFRAIMAKPYPYFVGKFTGKISSYVTSLGREFREFLDEVCYEYVDLLIKLPIIATIMFTVNIYTGAIFVSSIIVMFFVGRYLMRYTTRAERRLTDTSSNLEGHVIDVISNFVSVKAFKREHIEIRDVLRRRKDVIDKSSRKMFWEIIFWTAMSIVVRWIVWPATIILNVVLYLHGEITLAQITTFLSALILFSEYIWVVVWHLSQLNIKIARMEESYRYLFGSADVIRAFGKELAPLEEGRVILPPFTTMLSLHKLHFAYPDKKDSVVLHDLSLNIAKNEKIGIVGASGSGKTTLIRLLLGYYELPVGMITLDSVPIDNRELVKLISYVPQDTALFHRSIGANIAYGYDGTVSQVAIEQAAKRAHAHEFIVEIDEAYDAVVGERGIKLSMGQRQRVAIARAFLNEKPILVLDEATSALDSESEVLVQESLEELWHNKTVIAIAHRLSTLRHMDRIVVMDKGRIVEQGTHSELLEHKGKYYMLWQHQSHGILGE